MIIKRHIQFLKHFKKRILPFPYLHKRFEERLSLFIQDPQNPLLKDHKLIGSLKNLRAFSVTGDVRIIYKITNEILELYDIGSHNQVY